MAKADGQKILIKFAQPFSDDIKELLTTPLQYKPGNFQYPDIDKISVASRDDLKAALIDDDFLTWWEPTVFSNGWIKIDYGEPKVIYGLRYYFNASNYYPYNFTISGSNDDVSYTDILTGVGTSTIGWHSYTFTSVVTYRYYKLNIIDGGGGYFRVYELQLDECIPVYNEAAFSVFGKEDRADTAVTKYYQIDAVELATPETVYEYDINNTENCSLIDAVILDDKILIENATEARYLSAPINVHDNHLDDIMALHWDEDLPEGTSIIAEVALNIGNTPTLWRQIISGDAVDFAHGSLKSLWIQFTLKSDNLVITPSISNICIKPVDYKNSLILTMDRLYRFNNVLGEITIIYFPDKGNLTYRNRAMPTFVKTFAPVDLTPSPSIRDDENISISDISATGTLISVNYLNVPNVSENISIGSITASGQLTYGVSSYPVSAFNIDDGAGDWGKYIQIVFNEPIRNVGGNASKFLLTDSTDTIHAGQNLLLSEDGLTLTIGFIDFNNADNFECVLSYADGTIYAPVAILDSFSYNFTPTNLIPVETALPEVEVIWNE